jgi:hypothetical protein
LTGRSPRFANLICARICAQDATGRVETGETQRTRHERPPSVRQGQRGNQRPRETAETDVVWLITPRRLVTPRCANTWGRRCKRQSKPANGALREARFLAPMAQPAQTARRIAPEALIALEFPACRSTTRSTAAPRRPLVGHLRRRASAYLPSQPGLPRLVHSTGFWPGGRCGLRGAGRGGLAAGLSLLGGRCGGVVMRDPHRPFSLTRKRRNSPLMNRMSSVPDAAHPQGALEPVGLAILRRYGRSALRRRRASTSQHLFGELGPGAPTLLTPWTTRDLAAHLVLRERDYLAGPGLSCPVRGAA